MTDLNTRKNPFLQSRNRISNQQRFNFIETIKTVVDKDKNYFKRCNKYLPSLSLKKKKKRQRVLSSLWKNKPTALRSHEREQRVVDNGENYSNDEINTITFHRSNSLSQKKNPFTIFQKTNAAQLNQHARFNFKLSQY